MMRIYMAHPIAGDVPGNIAKAKRWRDWLQRRFVSDAVVVAPYIEAIEAGADDSDPAQREAGLQRDCDAVRGCDLFIMVGGRVSSGMEREWTTAFYRDIPVLDLSAFVEPPEVR